jgi:hypothetical protein
LAGYATGFKPRGEGRAYRTRLESMSHAERDPESFLQEQVTTQREKLCGLLVLRDEVGRICLGTIVSRAPIIGPTLARALGLGPGPGSNGL